MSDFKVPEGYLPLLEKVQKNLNEQDLQLLRDIVGGKNFDVIGKDRIKKLMLKMTSGLNKWEKMQFVRMFLSMRFR